MKEVMITGSIRNIQADGTGISFDCMQADGSTLCVIDGLKSAVFHSLLMEGDPVIVTGLIRERDGTSYVQVIGLEILPDKKV